MELKRVNFGEVIYNIARENGIARTKMDLRMLPAAKIRELQKAAVDEIKALPGTVLVDMHLTVRTPTGIISGLPIPSAESLSPEVIILFEAPAQDVFRRSMKDKRKEDEPAGITLEELSKHMAFDRAAAICIATVPV